MQKHDKMLNVESFKIVYNFFFFYKGLILPIMNNKENVILIMFFFEYLEQTDTKESLQLK